ncbi:DUF5391 family protein [Ihubacter massiliensis]|uniref:DUF5391 family protein n=1 Tax=Hominibacterium faecale TaxID=2839743 RepID=A0A9J6QW72_9FIRM|nr:MULTISPECIES: DUF5391 family protein [Eubacteriales Family XIII. Incertae Sedis]MCC2864488.1 DUF5391 family protein [Anaerovorax odorimutans]MCI7301365.1 DUF5391 family protein [Clostridia bacterium]MDE8733604.1 DUF5391 family protein [Eubacteriales bacterium DFI.9.88]MDY3011287.1 DUF5391 family protein [Clostridiales Family XIII bacterium]MCO7123990.1 DUF5391 family protein [Ihubacter massiliensis]
MEQKRFVVMTIFSALLFMAITVTATLTPYAQVGHANQFASPEMYNALLVISLMYFIPLLIYGLHVKSMKYVLAFVVGIYTVGAFGILLASSGFVRSLLNLLPRAQIPLESTPAAAVLNGLCVITVIYNGVWYWAAFRRR